MKEEDLFRKSFLGTGWSFPPTFELDSQHGILMVRNDMDIAQSLEILLQTDLGERTMLPKYGSNINAFIFDLLENTRLEFLKEQIRTAVLNFEPRIVLHEIDVDVKDYLDGVLKVHLDYTVITTNTRYNLVFPYYKVEGTDIPKLYEKEVYKISDN